MSQPQPQPQTRGTTMSPPITATPPPPSTTTKKSHTKHSNKSQPPSGTTTTPSSTGGGGIPFKTMELTPAPRRRKNKRKLLTTNNNIPNKLLSSLLPESSLYTALLNLESTLDRALVSKKSDIQESIKSPPISQKTLRIYVFNTFANQPFDNDNNHNSDITTSESPSWTLKIIGNVLDNAGTGTGNGNGNGNDCSNPKFSSFFKKITIYLDQNIYPDNNVVVWENTRSSVLHQGFEVKRKGSKEFTAIIRLEMNYIHDKFKLSNALIDALGIEVETRSRVMIALWHYIKVKKLQDPNDPAFFMCDPALRKVFGDDKVKFAVASQKLNEHLSPIQPIHLEHRIKLSGNNPSGNMCYDVLVDVPFPLEKDMSGFLAGMENCKEIDEYDNAIESAIKKINEHRKRRAFFLGFSQSPAEFINTLIASQDRDLKVVGGDAIRNAEKEHRSDFFNQPWVEDAVLRYLTRKPAGGSEAGGTT